MHDFASVVCGAQQGANGGLAGADVHVLERTGRKVSVTGIDDHELPGLDIVICVAFIQINHGNKSLASKHTHPVDVKVEQDVTPGKLGWMISINATTRI